MINSIRQYNILFFVGCFVLLYNPPLLPINGMHIVGGVSFIYLMINNGLAMQIFSIKRCRNIFLFMAFWTIYLIFVVTLNSTSYEVCAHPIYYVIDIFPFATAIQVYNLKHNLSVKNVIHLMISVAIIQAIIATIAFFNSGVQLFFVKEIINYGYNDNFSVMSDWRAYGFAGSLTFGMPVIQSVLAIITFFYASKQKNPLMYLMVVLLLFSAVINARTTFIISIIGFFVLLAASGINARRKIICIVISLLVLLAFQFWFLPWLEINSFPTYRWLKEGLEDIDFFIHKDYGSSAYFSYATNVNKYELPDGLLHILFGTGHYTMGMASKYGYSSDVGYTNDVWLGGFTYVVFLYAFFYKVMLFIRSNQDPFISFIGTFLLVCYAVLNVKGIVFSMMPLTNFLFITYFILASEMESRRIIKIVIPSSSHYFFKQHK